MASALYFHCINSQTPIRSLKSPLSRFRFLSSSNSFLTQKTETRLPQLSIAKPKTQKPRPLPLVFALQTSFFKVIQTAWKISRDGIEAGTNLVPDSVPRPIARISVTVVGLTIALTILKSFLSTAFFVLATMGLVYFTFIALYKDEGSKGVEDKTFTRETRTTTSDEEALEEARRIMDKYK